ncbi:MAG: hypothetical protein H0X29_02085 [Parachlamydiaceae bacterium]|nr:hypothetical protein [Parachlamydiaceae bacterium]
MISRICSMLMILAIPLSATSKLESVEAKEFQNPYSSEIQDELLILNKKFVTCVGCNSCRKSVSGAELVQQVQKILRERIFLLPQFQQLVAQQIVIANLSNPEVIAALTQIITSSGIGGPTGPMGPPGPAGGPAGVTGATGATGAAGGILDYAYIYNEGAQVIPLEADITFDSNGPISSGFTHAPGTSTIMFTNAGIYKVEFSISGVEPNQFTMFLNGAAVSGATYGSGAGTQQNCGQMIWTMSAGDVLTLRNHTSTAAVTLQTLSGGTVFNANASISILKLN